MFETFQTLINAGGTMPFPRAAEKYLEDWK